MERLRKVYHGSGTPPELDSLGVPSISSPLKTLKVPKLARGASDQQ
jgi:hypothetical protein